MPITDIADRLRAAGSMNPSGTHPYEQLIDDAEDAIRALLTEGRIMRSALEDIADDNQEGCGCCSYNTGQALLALDSVQVGKSGENNEK